MPALETKHQLANELSKYILEIFIIFVGISISFVFEEWRDDRRDLDVAKRNLQSLRSSLLQDTFVLTGMINLGQRFVYSSEKLSYFKADSEVADSLNQYIDHAASYLAFKPNLMAYNEISNAGHTNLIQNDSLRRAFLSYYTSIVPYCLEWVSVDKTQTMTELVPEMSIYFPVVVDSMNQVTAKDKTKALRQIKLRNLLLMNSAYKKEVIQTYIVTKRMAANLLKRVDDELDKGGK
jgi:hypothetical protein